MIRYVRKRFDLQITDANSRVVEMFEMEKSITAYKGMLLTSNMDDMLYFRGSLRLDINKEEVFPEGYECKLLMSGINVSPNERYFDLKEMRAGNGQVRVESEDTDDGRTVFQAYRVSLYLDCIMDNEELSK
jgi:hypothetical protein